MTSLETACNRCANQFRINQSNDKPWTIPTIADKGVDC